jgi:hypothetical protein
MLPKLICPTGMWQAETPVNKGFRENNCITAKLFLVKHFKLTVNV